MPAYDVLTDGLGFEPYAILTEGLVAGAPVPGPPAMLTAGLGFSPYTLLLGGLWPTGVVTPVQASDGWRPYFYHRRHRPQP